MSNSNTKKKKNSDIKLKANSEAEVELKNKERDEKLFKLFTWLGVLCMIAYVVIIWQFWSKGRGKIGLMSDLMLASAIVGAVGATMLVLSSRIAKTKRMFSIGIGLLGVFSVALYVTFVLLLKDYKGGTSTVAWGSIFSIVTVGSLLGAIILSLIAGIRTKLESLPKRNKK